MPKQAVRLPFFCQTETGLLDPTLLQFWDVTSWTMCAVSQKPQYVGKCAALQTEHDVL